MMTRNTEENLCKEVVDLGSVVKGINNRNKGLERTISVMENRQESLENSVHNLDLKYDGLMAMVAQMNADMNKLNTSMQELRRHMTGATQERSLGIAQERGSGDDQRMPRKEQPKGESRMGNRLPKIDFPEFDGEDPLEWVRKATRYFRIHEVEGDRRTEIAELYLKGRAEKWFHGQFSYRAAVPWGSSLKHCVSDLEKGHRRGY